EQTFQHADSCMEGGADALRRFAVPTPVIELFADQTAREALRRVPEVGAKRERAPVDAGLHLSLEERLAAELLVPPEARLEARHRRNGGRFGAVHAGRAQQLHCEQGRQPYWGAVPMPRAVRSLAGENFGANPFARNARAFRVDRLRGGVRQIAHHLPADGRVRIEQPVDSIHGAILPALALHINRWLPTLARAPHLRLCAGEIPRTPLL